MPLCFHSFLWTDAVVAENVDTRQKGENKRRIQPWLGLYQREFDETNMAEQQLWICRWATSSDRQELAHPVESYFHTGWHFDTVFLGDSQRETEREKKAQLVKLSDIKCDLGTEKTFRALFEKSSLRNAARRLLLPLCKFLRDKVFALFLT